MIWNELLLYSLANDGLFIAERKTGQTLEYFAPCKAISARPTVTGNGQLYVMSNRGVLYAFDLD